MEAPPFSAREAVAVWYNFLQFSAGPPHFFTPAGGASEGTRYRQAGGTQCSRRATGGEDHPARGTLADAPTGSRNLPAA